MLKIILPMCGPSLYSVSEDFAFPKILTEINNKTLLEHALTGIKALQQDYELVVVAPEREAKLLDFGVILPVLLEKEIRLICTPSVTKGALCTCLLSIDELQEDDELLIISADQYLDEDLDRLLFSFRSQHVDAGVVTFNSIHPKWSYVKIDSSGTVCEAAEKKAISRNALIGLTYFRRAQFFIDSAKDAIRKDASVDGQYYVSACLNEMCLSGKSVRAEKSKSRNYFNFYDSHSVRAFEKYISSRDDNILSLTQSYINSFNAMDLEGVLAMFSDGAELRDPNVELAGREKIRSFLLDLFGNVSGLSFIAKNIFRDRNVSIIEFALTIDEKLYVGVDILSWRDGKIVRLHAYLY